MEDGGENTMREGAEDNPGQTEQLFRDEVEEEEEEEISEQEEFEFDEKVDVKPKLKVNCTYSSFKTKSGINNNLRMLS